MAIEKLTHPLTVKIAPERLARIQAMAAYHGMEMSEFIRHLIDSAESDLQQKHAALSAIFGSPRSADKGYIIDPRNGGLETLERLEALHEKLDSDVIQLTGGGGSHIVYVAQLVGNLPGKLGAGIDLKAAWQQLLLVRHLWGQHARQGREHLHVRSPRWKA